MALRDGVFGPLAAGQGAYAYPAAGGVRRALQCAQAYLEAALDAERGRWFVWLPVLFGCGIAIYMALPSEPPLVIAVGAVLLAVPLRIFLRATVLQLIFSSVCLMVALGFLDAKLRTMAVEAPVVQRKLFNRQLTGWVEYAERKNRKAVVTLRLMALEGVKMEAMPARVRVSIRGKAAVPAAGDAIRVNATLMPPPEPVIPGGFDYARRYWFNGIGGSGYAMGKVKLLSGAGPPPLDLRIAALIAGLRNAIAERVGAVLKGDAGAIAKALIMGERGAISKEANAALRHSGLFHVISISGLHMALTAGSAYWLIRAALALFPALALRFSIRAWAAVAALLVASGYLVISGGAVTAVRSYIMIAIMFTAVILNRPALSLRNVAFSGLVILVASPESLMDAGFQMSYAATAALIAYFETRASLRMPASWPQSLGIPVIGVAGAAVTTLVASLAVDPIAAFHFHRIATYSVLGNVLASPVEALVVMPMALLTLFVMPFGLEAWPLLAMERGIDAMMTIANFVSGLPGAVVAVPVFPDAAFTLMVAGGLWLIIWTGRWRYWGLMAIGAGLAVAPFSERPDIWVARDGRVVAVRDRAGRMAVGDTRRGRFHLEKWLESDGDMRTPKDIRRKARFQCDGQSCIVIVKGRLVSYIHQPAALADDCRRADVVIVSFSVPERCREPRVFIDLRDLRERGAYTVRFDSANDDPIVVEAVADTRGARPWVLRRPRRTVIPPVAPARTGAGEAKG